MLGSAVAAWIGLGLLPGMALVSVWMQWRRGLDDCGCHGTLLPMTPRESAALTAGSTALMAVFLISGAAPPFGPVAAGVAALVTTGLAAGLAWHGLHRGPLLRLSPLRVGRPWRVRWVPGVKPPPDGLIVLATPHCAICFAWLRAAESLHQKGLIADVAALVAGTAAEAASLRERMKLRMAVHAVSATRLRRLSRATPAGVVLRGGIVSEIWQGRMPPVMMSALRSRPLEKSADTKD